jgi:hypothetical protein
LITDEQLVTFYNLIADERKLSASGPFYDFKVDRKKNISCIRRIPHSKNGWNITAEPKVPRTPKTEDAQEDDNKNDFPYNQCRLGIQP